MRKDVDKMPTLIILVLAILLLYNTSEMQIITLAIVMPVVVAIGKFIGHLNDEYTFYKQMKQRELDNKERERQKAETELKLKIEAQRRRELNKKHAEKVYSDILNGKRPPINFDEIFQQKLDSRNPEIILFCRKNNITLDDLIILNDKLYNRMY
jgi:hypothetical protein